MTPDQLAFVVVLCVLGGLHVAAMVVTQRAFLERLSRLLRARARGRHRPRTIYPAPPPQRRIGFEPLILRDSQPPPSSLAAVTRPIEPTIHYPSRSVDTRGLVRPRCRTRGPG